MNLTDHIIRITKQDEVRTFPKTKKPSPTKWKKAFHWLTANPHTKESFEVSANIEKIQSFGQQ